MPKCDFNKLHNNFIEITLRHGCSPANLLHILGTPFRKNTCGRLLLIIQIINEKNKSKHLVIKNLYGYVIYMFL